MMSISLASPYHDEHGRPLGPALASPQPTDAPPVAEQPTDANAEAKSQRRREAARKTAATVRQRKAQAQVDQAVNASLDQIAAQIAKESKQARKDALDPPGTPTARDLVKTAREHDAEATLYRFAHEARVPWSTAHWSPAVRARIGQALAEYIANRTTTKKGTNK